MKVLNMQEIVKKNLSIVFKNQKKKKNSKDNQSNSMVEAYFHGSIIHAFIFSFIFLFDLRQRLLRGFFCTCSDVNLTQFNASAALYAFTG